MGSQELPWWIRLLVHLVQYPVSHSEEYKTRYFREGSKKLACGDNFFLPTFPSGSWWVGYALWHDGLYHVFRFNPIIFICYLDCSSF